MAQPTDKITITLEAQHWQTVVTLLAEGPYRLAAPLIATLQEQFNAQAQELEPTAAYPNGHAEPAALN